MKNFIPEEDDDCKVFLPLPRSSCMQIEPGNFDQAPCGCLVTGPSHVTLGQVTRHLQGAGRDGPDEMGSHEKGHHLKEWQQINKYLTLG
jgi:hypothetical protein